MNKNFYSGDASVWIKPESFSGGDKPQNVHSFFRREFELEVDSVTEAELFFTADDYCKIYINGEFVVAGPAPGYPFHYFFAEVDVSRFLRSGVNCIAVHCYYQGLVNRVWNSADGLAGLKLELKIRFASGDNMTVPSDASWRCIDCEAYNSERKFGYDTQFAEDIDMRQIPAGWRNCGFDDHGWNNAVAVGDYPHVLIRQNTALLEWNQVKPLEIRQIAPGDYLVDFGREVVGCTAFCACGESGQVVEVRHAEELDTNGRALYKMRANCEYQEFATLSGAQPDIVEFFDYKAFRYVELLGLPDELSLSDIWVNERHYPFAGDVKISLSDPVAEKIWDICALAVKLGTQDSYLDCMSREKGAYLGDAFVTGLSHLYLTGDSRMLRKVLEDFALSAELRSGLMAVAPGAFEQEIADYSLLWTPLLLEYYKWSGDVDFVKKMLPVADGVLNYFSAWENHAGLLADFTGKPFMVDWPPNLRDGYDDPGLMGGNVPQQGMNSLLNIYYYGTLIATADLLAAAGNTLEAERLTAKANALKLTVKKYFLRPQGFVDTAASEHISLHPNALALMFNMLTLAEAEPVIELIRKKRICCGVYFAFFVLKGLCNYNRHALAYELMTCNDLHSWQTMLNDGATTCMEAWGVEQKWNTSLCHPWASAPVYMLCAEIFGLTPASPGWKEIAFAPRIPETLTHGSLTLNIPQGKLKVSFNRDKGELEFDVVAPAGVEVIRHMI
ncbi:MAG: family 78 glycoside hydrolase catalytic domain [Victivallales bacterium]|nr:family 78 glycoside hydrolase catalytic domain [Victivallales bacterium]